MRGRDHQPVDHARPDSMPALDHEAPTMANPQHTVVSSFRTDLCTAPLDLAMISSRAALPPSTCRFGHGISVALAVVILAPSRDFRQRDSNRTMSVPRLSQSQRRDKQNAEISSRFHKPSKCF
jgi:hypothetical protein